MSNSKKKNKSFWFLLAFAGVAVLATLADFLYTHKKEEVRQSDLALLSVKADSVHTLVFDLPSGKFTTERKSQEKADSGEASSSSEGSAADPAKGWQLTSPIQDLADGQVVHDLLEALVEEKALLVVADAAAGKPIDKKIFGLEPPIGSLSLSWADGGNRKFLIGGKNFEGNHYLQIEGQERILLANSQWSARLENKLSDLRNRKAFRGDVANISGIRISVGRELLQVEKKDGVWMAPSQPGWKLDQNQVREILQTLANSDALDFVWESKTSAEKEMPPADIQKRFGINRPGASVILSSDVGGEWRGVFARDSMATHYLWSTGPSRVLRFAPYDTEKIYNASLAGWRDKSVPFLLDRDGITSISLKRGGKTVSREVLSDDKIDGLSISKEEKEKKRAEQVKLRAVLTQVRNLRAERYLGKPAKFSGEVVELEFRKGEEVSYSLRVATKAEKLIGSQSEKSVHLGSSTLSSEAFEIDTGSWSAVGLSAFEEPKAEASQGVDQTETSPQAPTSSGGSSLSPPSEP